MQDTNKEQRHEQTILTSLCALLAATGAVHAQGTAFTYQGRLLAALAQSFTIDWFTVDGGGGNSTGGVYSLNGTIGQPDAGAMSGVGFAVTGGFWSLYDTGPASPSLQLAIRRVGNSAVLSWPLSVTGLTLEYTTQLGSGVWTTEASAVVDTGTEHTVTVSANSGRCFYRLKK